MTFRFRLLERTSYEELQTRLDRAALDSEVWGQLLSDCAAAAAAAEFLAINSAASVASVQERIDLLRRGGRRASKKRLAECAIPLLCSPHYQVRPPFASNADALLATTSPTLVDLGGGGDGGLFGQLTGDWFVMLFVTAFHERIERYASFEGSFFCLTLSEVRQLLLDLDGLTLEDADRWERVAVKRLRHLCEQALGTDGVISVAEVY